MVPLEPWEKVYIKLSKAQQSFADVDPVHAAIGCSDCHGGKQPADFESAHDLEYGFTRDPSMDPELACGSCHAEIVASNANSMHSKGWGQRAAIATRELGSGADHTRFDECPTVLTEGFDQECASCHTTCGQCHISRPNTVEGGLVNSHLFAGTPDQTNNCLACHGSRIGVDYRGELEGNKPDVHYLRAMRCWDCHNEDLHADASDYASRYHLSGLPECSDCHSGVAKSNTYHAIHWPESGTSGLACGVCHSQSYNNCDNCHTAGQWQEGYTEIDTDIPQGGNGYLEYPDFKIGYNATPNLHAGEYVVVRHIPVARDSYQPWGHAALSHYDELPTWRTTSPHNVRRFTSQTDTSGQAACYENCHVVGDKASMNSDRFLWQSLVESRYPDESAANAAVTVDDHLPAEWSRPE